MLMHFIMRGRHLPGGIEMMQSSRTLLFTWRAFPVHTGSFPLYQSRTGGRVATLSVWTQLGVTRRMQAYLPHTEEAIQQYVQFS